MPVPLGLPLGLAAGAVLAWLGGGGARATGDGGALRVASHLGALVLGPSAAYLELVAPAWANLYAFDLPSAFDLVLVLAVAASPVAGAAIARRGLARRDARGALVLAAGGALSTVGGAVAFSDRIGLVTTHRAFHGDLGGDALLEHRAGAALVGVVVAVAIGLVIAVRRTTPPRLTNRLGSPNLRS